jgi:hypothetical protein
VDEVRNKRKILKYLVPVEINTFTFPTQALLEKYGLNEYIEITQACMNGDLISFEQQLELHMDSLVQQGVYLVVERLRHLTLRNLVKKVALAVQKDPELQNSKGTHIVRLDLIFNILREWDPEMDIDELECMLANQI